MMFWLIFAAMALVVAAVLGRALLRGDAGAVRAAAEYDLQVYRDQLAEVERDLARGVIGAEDATRIRTEVSRRILAADKAAQGERAAQAGPAHGAAVVAALVLVGGSMGLYALIGQPGYGDLRLSDRIAFAEEIRESRASQQVAMAAYAEESAPPELTERETRLLEQLRSTAQTNPDEVQLQRYLAQYETMAGNFEAAIAAQRRVIELQGEEAGPEALSDYAEILVLAAGGYVSPEAEAVLRSVLLVDDSDGRARYFIGLMLAQTGRPDLAFRIWDRLLREGPEDAAWIAPIRAQIMRTAALAGVEYTQPPASPGAAPGPSAEDIEAASTLSAEERMEMIGGMVAGLSDRLAREGGPPQDWARLITSLGVLGERDRAAAIYAEALTVFAEEPGALDVIRRAGEQAGVDG